MRSDYLLEMELANVTRVNAIDEALERCISRNIVRESSVQQWRSQLRYRLFNR